MEQSAKKKVLIWGSLLAIAGVGGYFLWKKFGKKKSDTASETGGGDSTQPVTQITTTQPVSTSSPLSSAEDIKKFQDWMDVKHPNWVHGKNLNKGGGYGSFGPSTSTAWNTYGAEYKTPITTTTTPDPKTWKNGELVYIKGDKTGIFSYPNSGYLIGQVKKSIFLDKPLGKYIKAGPAGYHQIAVVGYEPYNKETLQWEPMKVKVETVYVSDYGIQKTPY